MYFRFYNAKEVDVSPSNVPLSERLGLLPGFEQVIGLFTDTNPLLALALLLVMSQVVLRILRLHAGRILRMEDEWRSYLATSLLAVAIWYLLMMIQELPRLEGGWRDFSRVYQVSLVVVLVVFTLLHQFAEKVYVKHEHWMPTAIWHNWVTVPVTGFLLLFLSPFAAYESFKSVDFWDFLQWGTILFLLYLWFKAAQYDGTHKVNSRGESKFALAHAPGEWRGNWRALPAALRRFREPGTWKLNPLRRGSDER